MARNVFVSYSHTDRDCAFELVARLEAQGIDCWIAPRNIAPSSDWAAEIIDAISAARLMVLVFSGSSNQSSQVRREVERAVHKQVQILPFRIQDVLPSKSLEYFLSAQHWMDAFPPPLEAHYSRLCAYLKTQLSVAPAEASAAISAAHSPAVPVAATDLRQIELQLASFIGPLAKHLVKQAALRANGLDDLIAHLATEIDSAADRRAFEQRCRQHLKPRN